ncbi:cardiolipin synthetase [Salmonella enterica subsp. enterica]|uniref:Cardiolipin synthetase n=1 Tax=Salmonella enterica I TaxID=59201 RepID=A0A447N9E6_SALET|nr:cardiolipin synthetase [Salmonella enterica subsp. enterica]
MIHCSSGWASRAFFSELLAAGVKIYQFEGGLLHTKSVLVDGELKPGRYRESRHA